MSDEKDFKFSDFITRPTILRNVPTLSEYVISNQTLLNKVKTFSTLITDKILKESFDEYFKEYI